MNNLSNRNPEFLGSQSSDGHTLLQYVQSLNPETIAQMSQPDPEVAQVMEQSLMQMLGNLPPEHFGVTITTSRENLGRLLASAMMNGYFLHTAKQRLEFEKSLSKI